MRDFLDDFEPLPPYTDPRSVLRTVLPSLRPAEKITVTAASERDMRVNVGGAWQSFRRDVTPYMVEPTDQIASRLYASVVFCGPSQSGKTQMLLAAISHAITADPCRVALFQMTRDSAAKFVRDKLSPMVRNSPNLRAIQAKGRGADNQFQKLFVGGTHLTIDWPTISNLSSATIRLVLGTDYDHFPESVDGEGDAFTMMRARTRTFMSRGMVAVESSPAAPITDESWRAASVHDCPPVRYGVLSLYPQGTRARWYWDCPLGCGEVFEPRFDRLRWPDGLGPEEAGARAEMMCPGCGGLFGHEHKRDLNASGRWLHESRCGTKAVVLGDPEIRRSDMVSYWLNGAAAAFSSWSDLVAQHLNAMARFDATGDESQLKSAANTGQGVPYLPRAQTDEQEISVQALRDKQRGVETPKGVAPSWARYLVVCVDTQMNRWDVGVIAFGANGRHQLVDRFDVFEPPKDAPGAADRVAKPFDHAEDWVALAPLAQMSWPVEGEAYALRPVSIAVDMQGGGQTTENAYAFVRDRRKAGERHIWRLTRGSGGTHTDRVWLKEPERARSGRRVASDIKILNMATDRLKDAVASSLIMQDDGQNMCFVPAWVEDHHLAELAAERRGPKGWDKKPGQVRNEALDHLVQARAQHIILRGEKIDWEAPPEWAVGGPENSFAVPLAADVPVKGAAQSAASGQTRPAAPKPAPNWVQKRKNWI